MPQDRLAISPGRLYTLLAAEFKKRKSPDCLACRMPLPFLISRPDGVSANWRVGNPPSCKHGCDTLIAEVAAAAWPLYDLHDPSSLPRAAPETADPQAKAGGEADTRTTAAQESAVAPSDP
jgi:hypothetical protein